jgi:aminopeptidase N
MLAVENLLRDMTVALQARLPMASKLYAVAVGRFAFFTPEPMALSLSGIALRLQEPRPDRPGRSPGFEYSHG